jgi:PAS domain S-box-containing protein
MTDKARLGLGGLVAGDAETLLRSVGGLLSELVYAIDTAGRITYASDAALPMLGYRPDEIVGRPFGDFVGVGSMPAATAAFVAAIEQGQPSAGLQIQLRCKDGRHLTGELHGAALVRDGAVVGTFGLIRDVTDRLRAEQLVRENEERYRVVVSHTSEAIFVVQDGRFAFANDACLTLTGLTHEQFIGLPITALLPAQEHDRAVVRTRRLASGALVEDTSEFPIMLGPGSPRLFRVQSRRVEWNGAPATLNFARDVTEARAAERALQDSEASYRGLFNTIGQAIYIQDATGRFIDVNDGALQMYGYTREEMIGMDPGVVAAPGLNDLEAVGAQIGRAFQGEPQQFEFWGRRKNGEIFPKDVRVYKGTYFGKDVLIAIAADITERKRAEAALRESEQRYRVLFESINDAVFVNEVGPDFMPGRFLQVNDIACRRLGYSRDELLTMSPRDISTPEAYARASSISVGIGPEGSALIESIHVTKDGRRIPVESSVKRFQYLGRDAALSIARDVTDRKRAEGERLEIERRMQHVQKLESLGVLAGGIAHDFNNILVAVLGYADLALSELPSSSPARESVGEIEIAARRAAELCRQMLAYSGRGKFVIELIDLGELVADTMQLLRASVSKRATLELELAETLPVIEGDATQLRQVLMNLVTNASEAVAPQAGFIRVSTGVATCDREELSKTVVGEGLPSGEYVYLEVDDNGCGMDEQTRSRIFEPFFTTKFTGRGLGMAAALGIVRGHKGTIAIRTAPGEGTTFRVFFPITALPAANSAHAATSGDSAPQWTGHGCVLLVDDEESVRGLASRMLVRLGFEVIEAANGYDALAQFERHADRISLVLLDLTMPGMDGEETFRALRRISDEVPVLMTSGFTEQEITARLAGQGLAGFLQKPYSMAGLRARVRKALEQAAGR